MNAPVTDLRRNYSFLKPCSPTLSSGTTLLDSAETVSTEDLWQG